MIHLDGSAGGGQLLRTALSLSALLQQPFRMDNIRGARGAGGLKAQHLSAVRAVCLACGAQTVGAELGSKTLQFTPSRVQARIIEIDIGTAGSTVLVLQTLLPLYVFGEQPMTFSIRGGTAVPWSPSVTYLQRVFLPAAKKMGVWGDAKADPWGFYPVGGGLLSGTVTPSNRLSAAEFAARGNLQQANGVYTVAGLPIGVAQAEEKECRRLCGEKFPDLKLKFETRTVKAASPGNECYLEASHENAVAGFDVLGEKGKPSARVAREAFAEFTAFESSRAAIDARLADQLLPYAALAPGTTHFTVPKLTEHLETNARVIHAFLGERVTFREEEERVRVTVRGAGFQPNG